MNSTDRSMPRKFRDGAPKTTERPAHYHAHVADLLDAGWRWDDAYHEWVSPEGDTFGRLAWDDSRAWMMHPGTMTTTREVDYRPTGSVLPAGTVLHDADHVSPWGPVVTETNDLGHHLIVPWRAVD